MAQAGAESAGSLPVGTVTFLLADVEGSTSLWESTPEEMPRAMARLDRVVDDVVAARRGVRPLEQGEGDSFVAVFTRASDAVAAALDLQRADLGPIRLRIGLHTGEAHVRDDVTYLGTAINRCARLRNTAAGGQTVLSQVTADLVIDHLDATARLIDLGTHRLRDLARPERVYQLTAADVPSEFPPLRSLDAYPHNLPVQLTTFVGRGAEMKDVRGLVDQHRLVTLTGSGGCGKTRLVLQVAADLLTEFAHGVWHVDLVPVADPDDIPTAIARTLGMAFDTSRSSIDTVAQRIGADAMVVILDNCEHLIAACATTAEVLLRACPGLTLLATSREPLGVAGEVTYLVPSLAVPSSTEPSDVGEIAEAEAVQLFVERACRLRPAFDLSDTRTAIAVAEICRRLDGIPLAIELAAARVRVLAPEQIAAALKDRFRLLTGGSRTAMPRQQTLRASVDWSHDLLTDIERVVFRRLAVFAGSFDLEAAEAVVAFDGVETYQVLDQLTLLVDKSLVVAFDTPVLGTRYRLLETVRQYALERLADAGEVDAMRQRHLRYFVDFSLRSFLAVPRDADRWLVRTAADLDNVSLAVEWSLATGDATSALALGGGLWVRVAPLGYWGLGRRWLDEALRDATGVVPEVLIPALIASGHAEGLARDVRGPLRAQQALDLAMEFGDRRLLAFAWLGIAMSCLYLEPDRAVPALRESVALARDAESGGLLVASLTWLGLAELMYAEPGSARDALEEALDIATRIGSPLRMTQAWYATALGLTGDLDDAIAMAEDAIRASLQVGDIITYGHATWAKGFALGVRGDGEGALACSDAIEKVIVGRGLPDEAAISACNRLLGGLASGDPARALAVALPLDVPEPTASGAVIAQELQLHMGEAELAIGRAGAARDRVTAVLDVAALQMVQGWGNRLLARIDLVEGNIAAAESAAHRALDFMRSAGDRVFVADLFETLAGVYAASSRFEDAARLLGAASSRRDALRARRFRVYDEWFAALETDVRGGIGDDAFSTGWAEGASLSTDEVVAYVKRGRGERKRPATGWESLTPTEIDVVRLVAEGLGNRAIAEKLFVSPRTVQAHLTHVYTKLGLDSRVQLATEAARGLRAQQ